MKSGVYKLTNANTGDFYIGSSVNLRSRRSSHLRNIFSRAVRVSPKLRAGFPIDQRDAFVFEVLEYVEPNLCHQRESHWIASLRPTLNSTPDGGGGRPALGKTRIQTKLDPEILSAADAKRKPLKLDRSAFIQRAIVELVARIDRKPKRAK